MEYYNIIYHISIYGVRCDSARRTLTQYSEGNLRRRKGNMSLRRKTNDPMDIGLMQIEDDEGSQLSDQEVLDNIVGLVIASTWAIYYLAKYPHVLAKLREENTAACKNKKGDFITRGGRNYKNGQLAIIAAFVFRMATREVEYKDINGYTHRLYKIPRNWKVIIWARYFHTNPESFEDPTQTDGI
ncbi:hypothetical protein NC652_029591 [Populus alba x Populus x berolinensis]|nr:hypothetical protein NC652_029591 [Populus alba x Populus x berolinensis]